MKDTLYRYEHFRIYDFEGIARHLESMAAMGWLLEDIGSLFWRYRRIEPRQVHFAVTYLSSYSALVENPSPEELELDDMCASAGWWKVTSNAHLQIFCSEESDPIPLETSPTIQIANIHKSVKRNLVTAYTLYILIALILLSFLTYSYVERPILFLCNMSFVIAVPAFLLLILSSIAELHTYFRWHSAAEAAAEDGILLAPRKQHLSHKILNGLTTGTMLLVIFFMLFGQNKSLASLALMNFILIPLVTFGVRKLVNYLKIPEPKQKIAFTVGIAFLIALCLCMFLLAVAPEFFQMEPPQYVTEHNGIQYHLNRHDIPLKTEDLISIDPDWQSYNRMESDSILLQRLECHQRDYSPSGPSLVYTIYDSPFPWILDMVVEHHWESKGGGYAPIDPGLWEAEAAYGEAIPIFNAGTYLIRWEGRVVYFDLSFGPDELTPEQIATVVEALKP